DSATDPLGAVNSAERKIMKPRLYVQMPICKLYRSLPLVLCLNIFAVVAHATTITLDCTPNPVNVTGGGYGTVTCPAFNVPGAISLDRAPLTESGSFTGSELGWAFVIFTIFSNSQPVNDDLTTGTLFSVAEGATGSGSLTAPSSDGVTIAMFSSPFS